ncbi:MAG: signal peptidase I [Dehalococcoidia bacterium]
MVGLGLLVAASTLPTFAGYHTYVVNGGSMEPSMPKGSAAVARATSPSALEVGDVIARRSTAGGEAVLHRIVDITTDEGGQRLFVLQGDQNRTADPIPLALAGPGDKVVYSVPYAGYLLNFAGSLQGRLLLIVTPIALLGVVVVQDVRRWLAGSMAVESEAIVVREQAPATDDVERPASIAQYQDAREAADLVLGFLLRHSGERWRAEQCEEHPSIDSMATLELLNALRGESGLSLPMQAILQACDELRIARPAGHGSGIEAPPLELAA